MVHPVSSLRDTALALASRVRFIAQSLDDRSPRTLLDIGCGSGQHLTQYLAQLYPEAQIHGVDDDEASLDQARTSFAELSNLSFHSTIPGGSYDVIIASEVLEHVAEPEAFLRMLREHLAPDGMLILTVPNGFGPSEWMGFLEQLLVASGLYALLRRLKRALLGRGGALQRDTYAHSPHIHFFTRTGLRRLGSRVGFAEHRYAGRMFLHNFLLTLAVDALRLGPVNAKLGAILPAWMVSDRMCSLPWSAS